MQAPALDDTIIAVSTGWQAAPLGIVRLSGPAAFELAAQVGVELPARNARPRAGWCDACLTAGKVLMVPVTAFWFAAPRSYTRQDVIELHTIGSLPALRVVSSHLIELGARRALPGEFTARAFLNGRLDADQVDSVLGLIHTQDQAGARQAARLGRGLHRARLSALNEQLTDLIAEVEAGIDFVEEEDVHFITPQELCVVLDQLIEGLEAIDRPARALQRAGRPHVALAGLPNGGKSTLFNALLGYERAIVSPVLGTTRDVLSAEIEVGPIALVLQDCAGLGASADELESAAHLAAEQAADQADLVLWVHDCTTPWDAREAEVSIRIPEERRVLVVTKLDRARGPCDETPPASFAAMVQVSAISGLGLGQLRYIVAERLESLGSGQVGGLAGEQLGLLVGALRRAREIAAQSEALLALPEVIALELRRAWEALGTLERGPLAEEVLGRILERFCVGK